MSHPYKITISNIFNYREFEIAQDMEKACLGTTSACEFRLNREEYFCEIELMFELCGNEWRVLCNDEVYFSTGDARKLGFCKLKHGDALNVKYVSTGSDVFLLEFAIDFEAQNPKYNSFIDVRGKERITIGDSNSADLRVKSNYSLNTDVCLCANGNGFEVEEKSSTYGTCINGLKINRVGALENYDFLSVSDVYFFYKEGRFYFDREKVSSNTFAIREKEVDSIFDYPIFVRNTRRKIKPDNRPIKVLDPSTKPTKPELHLVTSLMPTIVMFVMVVVLRGIMSTTMGTYIIFSICSMGLGVITTVAGLVQGQKKYKEDIKKREEVYKQYIEKKEKEIWDARENEIATLNEIYYSPVKGIEKVLNFASDSFDRISIDSDFLDVYLGVGRRVSGRQIEHKLQEQLEEGDDLCLIPESLHQKYMYIENAPITLHMRTAGAVGIAGSQDACYQMFKNIVADIVCRQFSSDVTFYLLIDEEIQKYDWMKRLPQLQPKDGVRNVVFNSATKANVFEDLFKELTFRSENEAIYKQIVVFVINENGITNHPLARFVENAEKLQTTFVFFENSVDFLPLHCREIIELNGPRNGILYSNADRKTIEEFTYELIDDSKMCELVNKIAPVYSEEISLESTLRKNISLFELLGIYLASDVDLSKNWASSKIYESMAAPLGVNSKNEIITLDLHEKAHGPHGLVAGTTGSGKSEILQSFILSCALNFHPYEIGFVIIDFKGGGMANQFKKLPHLIGTITNIDGKEINRSLKSIKAELLRRQELFAKAGVNQIDKYIKLYKSNDVSEPLPHLVIIVDEFAELKAEQPEFMKELISAARIGRSLGVHLILATQKPAGQVNEQIWSNSKFKLCLKVQDQQDSKEVIKSPLAAEIKEPGRAYLQVGNNEIFELFQSAYSGGPSVREDESSQKKFKLYTYGMEGRTGVLYERKAEIKKKETSTELEALVKEIANYCASNNIEKLPSICLPSLQDVYLYNSNITNSDSLMQVPIGIYDDPDHQYQGEVITDIGRENAIIIGSSQMGKTNLLQIFLRYLSYNNSPEEVNFYILDFGSMILKNFEALIHVGGVVLASEDEKVKNLFKLLLQEMDIRKRKLMNAGVSSFYAYKDAGFADMAKIYVLLDNFNAFKELYMEEYEQSFVRLCRDGISLGISIVITNASTTGIGYRHLSNFSNRICFTCNENSDYSTLLTRCRMEPKAVAGRMLFQRDKIIYEAQTYLAFEGEKEIDRANAVRDFVNHINEKYEDHEPAQAIPCIPDVLHWKEFKKQFWKGMEPAEVPLGLDFASIEPVLASTKDDFEFAVIAKKRERIKNFLKNFIKTIQFSSTKVENQFFIIDSVERELKYMKDNPNTQHYTLEASESELILEKVLENLKRNKASVVLEENDNMDFINNIVILNSKDSVEYISTTKPVLEKYKEILAGYKNYGILFVYAGVDNVAVAYSGPEILKRIKDSKKVMLLDNINTVKLFDIPAGQIRAFSKDVLQDEGYWINGAEIKKVKLFNEVL